MKRRGEISVKDKLAGLLIEEEDGSYTFTYNSEYRKNPEKLHVSLTMPLREEPYRSAIPFPFFNERAQKKY